MSCHRVTRAVVLLIGVALTLGSAGCGGAYYTMDGATGTKIITIHDGETNIKVPVETAGGGSLSGGAVNPDGTFVLQQDAWKVSGTVDPTGRVAVKDVVYKGKKLGLGSMTEI